MPRPIVLGFLLLPAATAVAAASSLDDLAYARANARLAKAIPNYPGARLLVEEPVTGEVGPIAFEAVQRIASFPRATTQRAVIRFYSRKLGPSWGRRGTACFVSKSRLVVTLVSTNRRRLGVLVDSRGAARCYDLTGQIGDLLDVGYPRAASPRKPLAR
jgi:hypothetical protein